MNSPKSFLLQTTSFPLKADVSFTRSCVSLAAKTSSRFSPVILVLSIGCYDGHPFIMDTHPVTLEPGKGNGLLLIGKQNSRELWKSLCVWLWQRLDHGGVKPGTCQSLAVVSPKTR